jgi:hypothetical protein
MEKRVGKTFSCESVDGALNEIGIDGVMQA